VVSTVEIYKEIRKLHLEGLSQRRIADKLVSPETPWGSTGTANRCRGNMNMKKRQFVEADVFDVLEDMNYLAVTKGMLS